MRLSDLLKSSAGTLPKGPRKASFRDELTAALGEYVRGVESLTATDSASAFVRDREDLVSRVASDVLAIHTDVLRGQPSHARRRLDAMLSALDEHVRALISNPVNPHANRFLFRVRKADPPEIVDRKGIFHMPYERRHRVGPQRYSVPGVPMLYLGSSLLLCWTELGKPDLDRVWVSRFQARTDLRVLNFGYPPHQIADLIANHREPTANAVSAFAGHYAVLWPLVAACSFRALYGGHAFVEEYVIPQLLTSWVSEQAGGTIDGIRYFSTRLDRATFDLRTNFVFVPREIGNEGHCGTLAGKLFPTEPLLWADALARARAAGGDGSEREEGYGEEHGRAIPYARTEWAVVESFLGRLDNYARI